MDNSEQIDDTALVKETPPPAKRWRISLPMIFIGVALLALVAAAGVGYWQGTQQRAIKDRQELDSYLADQYDLALSDIQDGRYDFAQQRLEEILSRNADFPGAQDALAKVAELMHATPTPIPTATAIPSPTPNLALGDQMDQKALQQYKDKDYAGMVQTLLTIQRDVPSYQPLHVASLLFVGYREEGLSDIRSLYLERGMYRLWQASRYAPLDKEANDKIDWSRRVLSSYQAAYRFRKTDLEKSVINFSVVYMLAPGYRSTLAKDYQDTLDAFVKKISDDNCYIKNKLNELLVDSPNDNLLIAKRDAASDKCVKPAPENSPTP
jgi:hypothetical protein